MTNTGHPSPEDSPTPPATRPWGAPVTNGAGAYVLAGQSRPYPTQPQRHPRSTLILVLGIAGFALPILGPVAWILGHRARREIRAAGVPYADERRIQVGQVLGLIVTVLVIIAAVFGLIAAAVVLIMARTFGSG